jgi:hypothetical protein
MTARETIAISLVILILGGVWGCSEKKDVSNKTEIDNWIKESLIQGKKEIVSLLSAKYGVEDNVVLSMINDYDGTHDLLIAMAKGNITNDNAFALNTDYKKSILDISSRYSIKKETVASIILDYKIYRDKNSSENEALSIGYGSK